MSDVVLGEVILQAAEAGNQQIHLAAVPEVEVVLLQRGIPVVHLLPVNGSGPEQGGVLPAEHRAEVHRDFRPVKVHPTEVQRGVLHQHTGDDLVIVPVRHGEVGVGLVQRAELVLHRAVGVQAAEEVPVKPVGVLLKQIAQMLQRGIGQIGHVALAAQFTVNAQDVAQRTGRGKNTNDIHGSRLLVKKNGTVRAARRAAPFSALCRTDSTYQYSGFGRE